MTVYIYIYIYIYKEHLRKTIKHFCKRKGNTTNRKL